jgi:hypothetical protein
MKIWDKLLQTKYIWYAFIGCLVLLFLIECLTANIEKEALKPSAEWEGLDTYIPKGFRLVPIQITNIDALRDLVGSFAFVDLHEVKTKKMVSSGLRLIKSPEQNDVFAVLVADKDVSGLLKYGDEFLVIIRSRKDADKTRALNSENRKIIWEDQ